MPRICRHTRRRLLYLVCGWALSLGIAAHPAWALPDLVPEVFDVSVGRSDVSSGDVAEGCAGGPSNRLLLEYSLRSRNVGTDDLFIGEPMCPDCAAAPGATCGNPVFVCSPAHGHPHYESFAKSELLDGNGIIVAQSQKNGFCLLDFECATPRYSCSNQGISAGCSDVYERGLPCQYIDITDADLADGFYTLRVTMDPLGQISEANETNNTVEVPVQVESSGGPCPRVQATGMPRTIPDNGSITSGIVIGSSGWVTRVRLLGLRITHPHIGDLEVRLRSPTGTEVTVIDRVCGARANVALDLQDGAASAIPCPATDDAAHQPSQAMTGFVGEEAHGTWALTVYDRASGNSGDLTDWSLEVCTQASCENATIFTANDLPKAIVDLATTSSTIAVPSGSGLVSRVEVLGLRGTHSYVGDLSFELESPSGRTSHLVNRVCQAHHDFDLSLSSLAPTAIPCPPTDGLPHLPTTPFTTFLGEPAEGSWILRVRDQGPGDSGSLTHWGMRICPVVASPASCPSSPATGCNEAARSQLLTTDGIQAQDRTLKWKWQGGNTALADLGNPTAFSGYALCVYADGTLLQNLPIASGGTCSGHACWRQVAGRGFRYRNRPGNKAGIDQVTLRSGEDSARLEIRAKGPQLVTPLPMPDTNEVRVQLIRSDSTVCWEATYPAPALQSDDTAFRDRIP